MICAGADGCGAGWVLATWGGPGTEIEFSIHPRFDAIVEGLGEFQSVALDAPIGLLEKAVEGGRDVDKLARRLLGPKRGSSVFPAPIRAVLFANSYSEALALQQSSSAAGKGLSQQCFNIRHLIRQIDEWITPLRQERVVEIHPELCFFAANGDQPVLAPKRTPDGYLQRRRILDKQGVISLDNELPRFRKSDAAPDDLLDAAIAAWTAWRHAHRQALRLPEDPPVDARGLRMEMWR